MDKTALLSILEKDYQELTPSELNFLRNLTREKYHWQGTVEAETLLQSYLIFKRRHFPGLETVFIEPRLQKSSSVFGGTSVVTDSSLIQTFDGINKDSTGSFTLKSGEWFPVLTVFYFEEFTEIICLSHEGHFFRISNQHFCFTI